MTIEPMEVRVARLEERMSDIEERLERMSQLMWNMDKRLWTVIWLMLANLCGMAGTMLTLFRFHGAP